jgi:hypothetical protein
MTAITIIIIDAVSILNIAILASVFVISTILVLIFYHLYLFFGSDVPVGGVAFWADDGFDRLTIYLPAARPLMLTPG